MLGSNFHPTAHSPLFPNKLWCNWPAWGNGEWRNNRHMYSKAGGEWAMLSDGDAPVAGKLSAYYIQLKEAVNQFGWGDLWRGAVSGCSHSEEEADTFSTYCHHPYQNQGKPLPFPWVWGTGVLDMAKLTSTPSLRTSASPCKTVFCLFGKVYYKETINTENTFLWFIFL